MVMRTVAGALLVLALAGCGGNRAVTASDATSTTPPDGECAVPAIRDGAATIPDSGEYVGLTEEAAREKAAQAGRVLVVLEWDGGCPSASPSPSEVRGDRVNVYLQDGRVVDAAIG